MLHGAGVEAGCGAGSTTPCCLWQHHSPTNLLTHGFCYLAPCRSQLGLKPLSAEDEEVIKMLLYGNEDKGVTGESPWLLFCREPRTTG